MLKQGFQSSGPTPTGRPLVGLGDLCYLYQRELYQQSLVRGLAVLDVALVHQPQRLVEHAGLTALCLFLIALTLLVAHFEQRQCLRVLGHQHVAHVFGQSLDEQSGVETLVDNLVEQHHDVGHLIINREVNHLEVVLGVEHVQVLDNLLVGDVALAERCGLVEDAECVAHAAVGLLGNDSQRLFLVLDALLLGHRLQVVDGVADGHAFEVVDLTTAQNGGQNLVLLRRGQDEDDVCGRFLERLQKGVEGCRGQHVHLVDDEHLVLAYLRRYARLLHQRLDVLHGVVRGSIELEDVERALFVEGLTRLTVSAGLALSGRRHAVDGFGEDASAGGFSHAAWPAEQVGVGQLAATYGILERGGERLLTYHGIERGRTVLSRRNNIFFHNFLEMWLQS